MIWNNVVLFVVSVKDQVAITLNYYKNIVIHYLAIFSTKPGKTGDRRPVCRSAGLPVSPDSSENVNAPKQHQVEINLLTHTI